MKSDSLREAEVKKTLERIELMKNGVDNQLFNTDQEEQVQIHIKVDNSVDHGVFLPSKIYPGQWRASEQTFRAMKKDIFALGDSIDELVSPYNCQSCRTDLDKQFWSFCPYCGERFLE
jgi:hypothetical protein